MNEFLKIAAALAAGTERLGGSSESPRLDAELLLARALDVARSYLFAHPEDTLDPAAVARFDEAIARRAGGLPMAYITGEKEFWSMSLTVSPDTLVPRPETEILVEQALMRIPRRAAPAVLDLGTGSGAVALAIARERPGAAVTATDISAGALAVARENANRHAIANVDFLVGDWTGPVADMTFDIIVSNPPYVPADDPDLAGLAFEPRIALAAGADGLEAIRKIAVDTRAIIRDGGSLLLEHGDRQADAVARILAAANWRDVSHANDHAGKPRVSMAHA